MPTVIGARFEDGVVIVSDRRTVQNGRIASDEFRRVYTIDDAAVGSPGSTSGMDGLVQTIEDEIRTYTHDHNGPVSAAAFERILADASENADVDALGAVRRDDGSATLLSVDSAGGVTENGTAAIGTGSAIAVGQLETLDRDQSIDGGTAALQEILQVVENRDTDTGPTADDVSVRDDQ